MALDRHLFPPLTGRKNHCGKNKKILHKGYLIKKHLCRFVIGVLNGFCLIAVLFIAPLQAQNKITWPKDQFGVNIGDDYFLMNYTQLLEYWRKLAQESPRIRLEKIGTTAEDRDQYMAIITSPKNLSRLDHYKEISRRLALAEGLTDDEARRLAREGKAVVWIDGGGLV